MLASACAHGPMPTMHAVYVRIPVPLAPTLQSAHRYDTTAAAPVPATKYHSLAATCITLAISKSHGKTAQCCCNRTS